jgi:hypothetical protein
VLLRSYTGTRFLFRGQEYRFIPDEAVQGVTDHPTEIFKV